MGAVPMGQPVGADSGIPDPSIEYRPFGERDSRGTLAVVRADSAVVDVVIVAYNSRLTLRSCVAPLSDTKGIRVIVVDNASSDAGTETVADLSVDVIRASENRGFAAGCNLSWRSGTAAFVLFLNPDARIAPASVEELVRRLEERLECGAIGPRIVDGEGALDYSLRRFPRLRTTYSQALFLHRLLPRAGWVDEVVREVNAYERPGSPEWVSGACVLVRRPVLEQLCGFDEGYFHYSEDKDLCRRIRDLGFDIRYAPGALVVHEGGHSARRASLLPLLARNRIRYATLHRGRAYALLERGGVALGAVTHLVAGRGGRERRAGHVGALRVSLSRLVDFLL